MDRSFAPNPPWGECSPRIYRAVLGRYVRVGAVERSGDGKYSGTGLVVELFLQGFVNMSIVSDSLLLTVAMETVPPR